MTAGEFAEWLCFWEIDPPRDVKHQHEAALISNVIASVNHSGKGAKPKLTDFLLDYTEAELPSKESVVTKLQSYFAGIAGT